ncbi:MAG: hypothetical protein COV32_03640 [Candidatus Yonathbacteria bacterium CG10_big_fil_rev_8_21_14_0_10_43_136]|uniref:Uncharacterized protein n=2 Tax=Parcubacteria group TaxID=1794811 RepID=A0A2M7Q4Y2_9BACT|nr:MAG: hypothetical protein AUK15_02285 [Candidatus Nomurabacteria bacterium CG2_30_43_9]PIQ36099.1 MAG: hypothetical protein COW60_00720 [Candidatus Yonathbacteria bacterium CG17_big_fil_post_rev_8_21_14_2_50_43_9]PIR40449.1 MAG: hypothetical protein COV32_03640 [Candidatus Yonathbacteria bacterium CG10_big_fil_rev_8_21_14_0_10_43_136]PIX56914.1 MAG: hypothetical protein COZ48_03660 [Candidatus Yonathbacteria bacterium CG_4_10_14_3_um_filter_43_12]PIY58130.1 MAG: hypothetical protein COY98_03
MINCEKYYHLFVNNASLLGNKKGAFLRRLFRIYFGFIFVLHMLQIPILLLCMHATDIAPKGKECLATEPASIAVFFIVVHAVQIDRATFNGQSVCCSVVIQMLGFQNGIRTKFACKKRPLWHNISPLKKNS